jgi:cbb3-type cytochrome oxidase subunit 3
VIETIMVKGKLNRILIAGGLTVCFTFCVQFIFCQTLQTITDKKDILIGEQIKLTIKMPLPLNSNSLTKWLVLPDSIPHFEIVETGKPDTTNFKDDSKAIEQTIIFTSFDSGKWAFPSLPVEFAGAAGQVPQIVNTDSFFVNVSYSPADSTNQLRDIKPIMKVSVFDFFWIYVTGGVLLLLLIIFLLYWYFKKKRKDAPATAVSKLSPFDEAMAELKKLDQFNLQDAAEVKQYHIKLADIFKNYIGRKQGTSLFNKTAGDLLIYMKDADLPVENISELATALRCTDAVKFARYLPLPDQSEDALQKIKETITLTEHKTQNP